jgi:AraC family transcriptional regulator, transcriptional activator FtrA
VPRLHRVVTLVLPEVLVLDFAAPAQFFGHLGVGRYSFELAGLRGGRVETSSGMSVLVERGLEALNDADTIVVPGFANWETATFSESAPALAEAHDRGARILSICTGAFVLAEAGLLNGRRATTHWIAAGVLAERYPEVMVEPEVLYIDEGSILTSAGVAAGLDLTLHVVRRDFGAATAADMARMTVIPPHREGGQAQYVRNAIAKRDDMFQRGSPTTPARDWALEHLDKPIHVDDLARRAAMSRRTFTRHFRSETGTTPAQWLLEQRLRAAQALLESTDLPIEQVATNAGFNNAAALRAHFARRLRTTPTDYRRQFSILATAERQP